MAIIKKNNFEIFEDIIEDTPEDEYFECDELIAPTIKVLNLKGYQTRFCCSGHAFISDIEMKIFNNKNPKDAISGTYEIEVIDADKSNYKVRCKQFVAHFAYILFCDNSIPSILPNGWNLEGNKISIEIAEEGTHAFEFFTKRLKVMKDLFEWANNLPVKEGN